MAFKVNLYDWRKRVSVSVNRELDTKWRSNKIKTNKNRLINFLVTLV